ncbi:MAG: NifU family protein [Flavobacteriales bacterium]|jgi:Fe-S cluster biogenesis protein NfuA|nr:NifU family protein [Crocinitomicaceae bacterium]NBX80410.1 NifU family protein [Flavobacteriales bacterium]NCA21257.1 NifU family protein [Crocinitomicaceae bacterium]
MISTIDKESITLKVNEAMTQLRPHLHADGGDMELVEITDEGLVKVRLLGSCSDCTMSMMTIKAGLVEVLKAAAPEVTGVESIA